MGEYLKLLNQVKFEVCKRDFTNAVTTLKKLLNSLNVDYTSAKNPLEKQKNKGAIEKLLPVLNDLKQGKITQTVLSVLKLDAGLIEPEAPIMPKAPEKPEPQVAQPQKEFLQGGLEKQPVAEETVGGKFDPSATATTSQTQTPPQKPKYGARKVLSPLTLDDYIGQEKAKESLKISIKAAKKEGRVLAHTLICSPYGLGKTTLATIIANEMEMPFFSVNATNLKDVKSLSLFFSKIKDSCIVFIDEIHSLKNDVQTVLLSILTDYAVSFINESGEEVYFELPPFTLIGATTQAGELLKPFLNRFAVVELVDYTEEEKAIIVKSKFAKLGYEIQEDAVKDVALRSRGIPRTIETFAKGIKDFAINEDLDVVTKELAQKYFDMYNIDPLGLGANDLKILNILANSSKPIALITMESKTGIQKEDLAYRYEPYLIKLGFMEKTERGRVITKKGLEYISGKVPSDSAEGQETEDLVADESAEIACANSTEEQLDNNDIETPVVEETSVEETDTTEGSN